MHSLKSSEEITLKAFLMAIAHLDRPLSPELQQSLHHLGSLIATENPQAFEQLDRIANHSPMLKKLYEQT
ncbi:MAG: hypothetical protein MUF49_15050 [Oculatellaceae cyanobacterium Prado106]|jgi:hypothetical protein|nr:hypothetical protein [Oculatellaceae cyanobacterium Prado106]